MPGLPVVSAGRPCAGGEDLIKLPLAYSPGRKVPRGVMIYNDRHGAVRLRGAECEHFGRNTQQRKDGNGRDCSFHGFSLFIFYELWDTVSHNTIKTSSSLSGVLFSGQPERLYTGLFL
jgi:hypothetical protein